MCYSLWYNAPGRWPITSWVHYTASCNTQSSVPEDVQNNCPKHVELTGIFIKPLLLHLVGCLNYLEPVPVAARSKAWVCGRLLAGIVGSNPTGGIDVCLLWVMYVAGLRPATSWGVHYTTSCNTQSSAPEDG